MLPPSSHEIGPQVYVLLMTPVICGPPPLGLRVTVLSECESVSVPFRICAPPGQSQRAARQLKSKTPGDEAEEEEEVVMVMKASGSCPRGPGAPPPLEAVVVAATWEKLCCFQGPVMLQAMAAGEGGNGGEGPGEGLGGGGGGGALQRGGACDGRQRPPPAPSQSASTSHRRMASEVVLG